MNSFGKFEEQDFVGERNKFIAIALVKFILELHPMKTKGVQEALHGVHGEEHEHREGSPAVVPNPKLQPITQDMLP